MANDPPYDPDAYRAFECGAWAEELAIVGRWSLPEQVLETLLGGMGRTKALVEAQSPEARVRIENAICDSARGFEKDGIIEIPMPAMLAWARKQ